MESFFKNILIAMWKWTVKFIIGFSEIFSYFSSVNLKFVLLKENCFLVLIFKLITLKMYRINNCRCFLRLGCFLFFLLRWKCSKKSPMSRIVIYPFRGESNWILLQYLEIIYTNFIYLFLLNFLWRMN